MTARSPSWSTVLRAVEAPALAALTLAAGAAPPEAIFSSTRRFALRTDDRARDAGFLVWVEEVAGRLERAMGEPLPAGSGWPLLVEVRRGPSNAPPAVVRRLHPDSRGMGQTLILEQPDAVPPADILAAAVSLMLARHVAIRQPADERDRAPLPAPDWFAAGLAGTLFGPPRLAFQRRAFEQWRRGEDPPLASLVAAGLPERPFEQMPAWTAFVAWLRRRPDFRAVSDRILRAAARREALSPAEVAATLNAAWTARDLAQEWDLAMAALSRLESPWSESPLRLALRLRAAVRVAAAEAPFEPPPEAPAVITPEALRLARGQPWSRQAAAWMLAAVERVPVGGDADLAKVAHRYRAVLHTLAQPAPEGWLWGWLRRRASNWALSRHIAEATRALDDREALLAAEDAAAAPPFAPRDVEVEAHIQADAHRTSLPDARP